MAEYIEREEFYEQMNSTGAEFSLCDALEMIANFPAADVAPVVHAQWIEDESGIIICPECKRGYNLIAKYTHYCPNCGAKMDGGTDHAAD